MALLGGSGSGSLMRSEGPEAFKFTVMVVGRSQILPGC